MKLSLNWMNELLGTDLNAGELADILTRIGLEVEDIQKYTSIAGGLEQVVTGKVLTREKHPDADRLNVCTVDIGQEEPVQIVCGAANVAPGQTVAVAIPGAVLHPVNADAPLQIKTAKIRGISSHGMICAEDELGIGNSHDGILVLPDHLKAGTPLAAHFGVVSDSILEINITPNRVDASCHTGSARDVAAWLTEQGRKHRFAEPNPDPVPSNKALEAIPVNVETPEACVRYAGITIHGIEVKESPNWLKHRLLSLGIKPINNVVDATNFVMMHLGHPLHAFDADRLAGRSITVRFAKNGEKITTLDEIERELHPEDLVIADAEKAVCIAGVFGGLHSGVSESTRNIFLESAWFHPTYVRKTARRYGLHTDASFRFERGANAEAIPAALHMTAALITSLAGGQCATPTDLITEKHPEPVRITLSPEYVNRLIGLPIEPQTQWRVLRHLGFEVQEENGKASVKVPGFKPDVTRPADLAEEIVRITGFDKIPTGKTIKAHIPHQKNRPELQKEKEIRQYLAAKGFYETVSLSLISSLKTEQLGITAQDSWVYLANPLSRDLDILRPDLLASMLQIAAHNLTHRQLNLHLYELGKTYQRIRENTDYAYSESLMLGLLISGDSAPLGWKNQSAPVGFFEIKGHLEDLFEKAGINVENTVSGKPAPGFSGIWHLQLRGETLATIYAPSPKLLKTYDIRQDVWMAQVNWDLLLKYSFSAAKKFSEISKFPGIKRDLALLVPNSTSYEQLERIVCKKAGKWLQNIRLFDVYTGKGVPENHSSYAIALMFSDPARTLREAEVDERIGQILQSLESEAGVKLRS